MWTKPLSRHTTSDCRRDRNEYVQRRSNKCDSVCIDIEPLYIKIYPRTV